MVYNCRRGFRHFFLFRLILPCGTGPLTVRAHQAGDSNSHTAQKHGNGCNHKYNIRHDRSAKPADPHCNQPTQNTSGHAADTGSIKLAEQCKSLGKCIRNIIEVRSTPTQKYKNDQADCTEFYRIFSAERVDKKQVKQYRYGNNKGCASNNPQNHILHEFQQSAFAGKKNNRKKDTQRQKNHRGNQASRQLVFRDGLFFRRGFISFLIPIAAVLRLCCGGSLFSLCFLLLFRHKYPPYAIKYSTKVSSANPKS